MSFKMHFFDEFDFDANGKVCATAKADLAHAQSNFLYLVSKYNNVLLQAENPNMTKEQRAQKNQFFIEKLPAILKKVEEGGDYAKAKEEILKYCLPKVNACATASDFAMVAMLNELIPFPVKTLPKASQEKFLRGKFVNNVEKGNIYTQAYDSAFSSAINCIANSEKKSLYSSIINLNRIGLAAERIHSGESVKTVAIA